MELRDQNGKTEAEYLAAYKTKHYPAPYLTADAVLVSEGCVLLIRRKGHPFLGCWALPGGFVNPDENAAEAALRELSEETGVTGYTVDDLYEIGLFSDPGRDPRGWVVSDVFLLTVDRERVLVSAGDDAADAAWVPIETLPSLSLAFDHDKVLKKALQRYASLDAAVR